MDRLSKRYRHCFSYVGALLFTPEFCFWFYAFHMPLFFILSGYTFSGKGKFADYLKKKIRTLLVPYVFVIITMCCNGVLAVIHGNEYHVFEILKLYII